MEIYKNKAADLYDTSISNITPTINPAEDTSKFGVGVLSKNAGEIRPADDIIIIPILCGASCAGGSANKKNY